MDFWLKLFDTSDFYARWNCGHWTTGHGYLHILSDIGVWGAYFAIPCILIYFTWQRDDLPFRKIFVLFGAFILLCGTTHLMEAIIFYWPGYRLAGVIKFLTATVSWVTVIALAQVIPNVLAMRSPEELEREIAARKRAENNLKEINEQLEHRVAERTSELAAANEALLAERGWFSTTLRSIGDAIITTDTLGKVTLVNPLAEELTGWTAQEAKGKPLEQVFSIMHEQTRDAMGNFTEDALREGSSSKRLHHILMVSKDGVERSVDHTATPIRDRKGNNLGAVVVFRDVTDRRVWEKRLQQSESRWRRLVESGMIGVGVGAVTGELLEANDELLRMFDFTRAELDAGEIRWTDRTPAEYHSLDQQALVEANVKGVCTPYEKEYFQRDGTRLPVLIGFTPVEGQPGQYIVCMHDLTELKQTEQALQRSQEELKQMVNAMPQLAWIARPDGTVEWYNRRWYEYTGTTPETMQSLGWGHLHDPDLLPQFQERWELSLRTGEPLDMVFPLKSRSGEFHPFLTRVMPLRDHAGTILRWFGTNTDISEQKAMQEELRTIAARLADLDRRKDEFLATLAHELRNPLAPIRTGLEILKMLPNDAEKREKVRQTMERQTQQLITLVDDLLDLSRITRGKLQLRKCRVALADVLESAIEAVRPELDECGHQLVVNQPAAPVWLHADPHRLAQVFSNLLGNAVKYTNDGGQISLVVEPRDSEVLVKVRDTGIGIPQEMYEIIFDMFAQVKSSGDRQASGLGIGLTLVRSLLDMHEGTIAVASEGPGKGSEFTIHLPVLKAGETTPSESSSTPASLPQVRQKVLVVDDNQAAASLLSMVVKMLGNEVQVASDGVQAVEMAEKFRPQVILMDIGMPRMNGYEAARQIRQHAWGKSLLMVALTGWGQEEDKRRTLEAGFDHHLVKPADPAELQRLLSTGK